MIHPDDDVYEGPGSNYEYCRFHPGQVVSNGMFDAPCGACEAAGDDWAEAWERNPENPERRYCGTDAPPVARWYSWPSAGCLDVDDPIPF